MSALATLVLGAQRGAGPQGPPPGSGLILGQVADATTGRPVPDALVTISGFGPPAPPGRAVALSQRPVITGADGRFVFRDLGAARLPIAAKAAGYIDSSSMTPGIRAIELRDGERITDLKIPLWRYAVASGSVVDEAGEPAVGVQVRAIRRLLPGQPVASADSATAQTDDRGVFRISTLIPGDYLVVVPQTHSTLPAKVIEQMMNMITGGPPPLDLIDLFSSGVAMANPATGTRVGDLLWTSNYSGTPPPSLEGGIQTYTTVFYPGVSNPAEATAVTLRSGEERSGIDVQLRLTRAARITGSLIGPKGPVANTGIRLAPAAMSALTTGPGLDAAAGATRGDGTFTLVGVPPGQYVATVSKRGGDVMSLVAEALGGRGRGTPPPMLYARVPIAVGGADVNGVTLTLHEGAKVSGRIEFDGVSPRPSLDGASGRGLSVRLAAVAGGESFMPFAPDPPPIDPSGRFTTAASPPGRYRLMVIGGVAGPSGTMWRAHSAILDGRDVLVDPFELSDANIDDVVLTLSDRWGVVRGMVTAGPTPARTATVALVPADVTAWIASGMPMLRTRLMPASRAGAYAMADLKPGDYLIAALDDSDVGELQDPRFAQAVARVATRITIAGGENRTLDLQIVKVTR